MIDKAHLLERLPTVAAAIASFAGPTAFGFLLVLPAGQGLALALALRSRLARAPSPQSARAANVLALRDTLASTSQGRYVVVQGPKGVGKTCVVETAPPPSPPQPPPQPLQRPQPPQPPPLGVVNLFTPAFGAMTSPCRRWAPAMTRRSCR